MPLPKSHLNNLYRTPFLGKSRKGFLRLDMNENVDGLPQKFVQNVFLGIDSEYLATYPDYTSLTKKIAEHNRVTPENICLSNGSDGAIKCIFDSYISSGDKVVLTDPTFAMYPVYCEMFNAIPIMVPYHEDFSFPLDEFLSVIRPDSRIAVIVNPNNPTGTVIERIDLKKILNKCVDHDVLLIIDEAYFYYYDDTFIEEVKSYSNLVVLRTFSKLCALANARIGYAAACPEIIQNLYKVRPTYDVNGLAAYFAEKLLDEPGLIKQEIEKVNQGKKFLIDQLEKNRIEYKDGKANFLLIKCSGNVQEIIAGLYEENILVSGGFKQDFLKNYLRVSVGSIQSMRQFCDSFFTQWEKLHKIT